MTYVPKIFAINAPLRKSSLTILWLLNFPLFFLMFVSYSLFYALSPDFFSIIYFIMVSIAQAGMFSWLLIVALPTLLSWISLNKLKPWPFAAGFATVGLFYLIADCFVYWQFRTHINATLLAMALSPVRKQLFDLTSVEYCSLVIIFGALLILQVGLGFLVRSQRLSVRRIAITASALIMVCALGMHMTYAWADALYEPRILLASELVPGFHGLTAKHFLARHHIVNTSKRPPDYQPTPTPKLNYPKHPIQLTKLSHKPNILVLAIDAWRFDSLTPSITPNLSRFARKATHYDNHYSGGNCTRAGLFSLFYSVNPNDFDIFYRAGKGPVLFDVLYQQGYRVGVYPSASTVSPPFHRTVFANVQNFEPTTPGKDSIERDKEITRRVKLLIQKTTKEKKPFFAFVFYDSAHAYNYPEAQFKAPFQPAKKVSHLSLWNVENQQFYRNQYQNALYFIDNLIGEVLTQLREAHLEDETIVIVTSDHGEEFNDNGLNYWGHNGNFTPVQTHVPLLVRWNGQNEETHLQHVTSHYDILPTLLNSVLGVQNALSDYSLGYLLKDTRSRDVIIMGSYSKQALFAPHQKLVVVMNQLGFFHVEDLHGSPLSNITLKDDLFKDAFMQMNHFHQTR